MVLQRSRLIRVLVAVALVALAAVGLRLSEGEEDRNFEVVRGVLGQPVAINDGTVTARAVRVGTSLRRDEEVYAVTEGLFVVVQVEIAATDRTAIPSLDARLLTEERRYDALLGSTAGNVPPGFAAVQDLVFEIDPAALPDLTLELDPTEFITAYPEHARIHLGITADNAEAWRAAGRDQAIAANDQKSRGI
jgi:hypothetical protein